MEIARKGYGRAARKNPALAAGLNIVRGRVCYADLAAQYRVPLASLTEVL
jgi:alanine dehydrogenase